MTLARGGVIYRCEFMTRKPVLLYQVLFHNIRSAAVYKAVGKKIN